MKRKLRVSELVSRAGMSGRAAKTTNVM